MLGVSAVQLENVGVRYPVKGSALAAVNAWHGSRAGQIETHGRSSVMVRALNNIDFSLDQGERLGLIGLNGSGKTTLLRVISGIIAPSAGKVSVKGRVSPLLSIQLGLDNQATGIENVFVRGAFLGISGQEIEANLGDIAEFSELGEYLSLPLNTYSSGMRLRLSFAIATAFEPDVLIMDEWLSAGDETFQRKAQERLETLVDQSGVFIFASQNRNQIRRFCSKALVLNRGEQRYFGNVEDAFVALDEVMSERT